MLREFHYKLKPDKHDYVIFNYGEHGSVLCEDGLAQIWSLVQEDIITIVERVFIEITNFDYRNFGEIERNYDAIFFNIIEKMPYYSFQYFLKNNNTYIYIIDKSDDDLIVGVRINNFDDNIESTYFQRTLDNGMLMGGFGYGFSDPINANYADNVYKEKISATIDDYIKNGYPLKSSK
jgi:hypothetical protein